MVITEERKTAVEDRIVVELDELYDNPWQPRLAVESTYIMQLADDIWRYGLLQEPMVRPRPQGGYELAFGHSRVKALAVLTETHRWPSTVTVKIKYLSDEEMAYVALSENRVRKDLTSLEVLTAWKKAIAIDGVTIQSLADRVGVDRTTMSKNLSILDMPGVVLARIRDGDMSLRAARELLCLRNDEHMLTDMIEAVIADCMWTSEYPPHDRPDYRGATVRQSIKYLTMGRAFRAYDKGGHEHMDKRWRPLFDDGKYGRPVYFDVDAFKTTFPKSVYNLPDGPKSGKREWTTEVKEWSKWNRRAKREAEVEAELQRARDVEPGGTLKLPPLPSSKPAGSKWAQALRLDPVLREVIGTKRAFKFSDPKTLSEAEQELLGTRVMKVDSVYSDYHRLPPAAYPEELRPNSVNGANNPPLFDFSQCRDCTTGAAWITRQWDHPEVALYCTNDQAFLDRQSIGIEQFLIERGAMMARDAREDNELSERLADTLSDLQAMLIVMSHIEWVEKAPIVQAWDPSDKWTKWRKYDIYPAAAKEFAYIVGSELPAVGDTNMGRERWARNVKTFFEDLPDDYDWRVPAALVLTWQARVWRGLGVPLEGESKDAEATPDAVSSES